MEIRVKSGRVEPIAGKFGSSRVVDRAKTSGQLNSGIFNFFVHSSIRDTIDGTHWNFKEGERALVEANNSPKVEFEHGKFNAVIITLVLCLCQHRSLYW